MTNIPFFSSGDRMRAQDISTPYILANPLTISV